MRSAVCRQVNRAALLVDPTDTDAIAEALCRLLEEQKLRKTLSQRGLRRAASPATSGLAERFDVITGVPQAIDSTIGMPNPS